MSSELLVDYGEDAATAQLGQLKLSTIEDQQWPPDESTLSKSGETIFFQLLLSKRSKKCSAGNLQDIFVTTANVTQKNVQHFFVSNIFLWLMLQRQTSPSHLMPAHRTFPGTTPFMTSLDIKLLKWQVCRSLHSFLYISFPTTSLLFLYFSILQFGTSQKCLQYDKYTVAQKIVNIFLQCKWSVFVHNPLCVSRWW